MKLIIHDLPAELAEELFAPEADTRLLGEESPIRPCIGCFGCWIKTPAQCVIRDQYGDMGELLSKCEELILVSRCVYGGYSPFVKNVLDRSISYIHPYFIIRNGEMHHRARYDRHFPLKVYLYGEISPREEATARKLVKANALNLHSEVKELCFVAEAKELGGKIR